MLVKTKENRPDTIKILQKFDHLNNLSTIEKLKYLSVNILI